MFQEFSHIKENVIFSEIFDVEIPSFQRPVNISVVNNMFKHIKKQFKLNKKPYFGVLDICVNNRKLYVVDGQHRFEALKKAWDKDINIKFDVLFYYVDYETMIEIFKIRNMNVEIPDYIINVDNNEKINILIEIQKYITNINGFCGKSIKRPYINITKLMDKISELDDNVFKTLEEFKVFYENKNKLIKSLINNNNFLKKYSITESMIEKCKSWNVYIGLLKDNGWIEFESS